MGKQRRIRVLFAGLGVTVTAFIVGYQLFFDYSFPYRAQETSPPDWPLITLFVVLCPPSLLPICLSLAVYDLVDVGHRGFYVLWALVGLLNAALYAGIGRLIIGLQEKTDPSATS